MTIAKDFASKASIAFVALAMIFSMVAPAAQAQSNEDLQTMINTLLAQIAALQGQVGQGGTSVASGVCPYTWTRDLNMGSTGADVMKLQQFLNANADTRVAAEGAGSVGMETEYYGPATAAAVSKMQVMYRADILTPAALVNPTGYFGPSTRAKANSLCTAAPVVTPGETETETETGSETGSMSLSGEGVLDDVTIESASDEEIEEGSSDAEVATVTFEAVDGDIEISRMDVAFVNSGVDMWDVLDSVSLWVDGDMIAEMDANDEDDYQSDEKTLRFSGIDLVAEEDEELEIVIAVSLQNNIDSDDLSDNSGDFSVSVDSVRYFDADGVAETDSSTGDLGDTVVFTVEEAGFDDEVIVKNSSNDPDAATLQVDDSSKSDWYTVFVFDLDTDNSVNDIEVTTLAFDVTTGVEIVEDVIDDAELEIDGVTITDWDFVGATGTTMSLVFDVDGDVTIDAGDRVEAKLMLRFKSANGTNYASGETVSATVDVAELESEGADDIVADGAASSETHTLLTEGIDTTMADSSAVVTSVDSDDNDYATFEIEVEVTAFEQDVYIPVNGSTISAIIATSTGTTSVSITLDSSADEVNGRYEITEGETETITLRYTLVQTATGSNTTTGARLQLNSIGFYPTSVSAVLTTQTTLPSTDYRTNQVDIIN